MNMVKHRKTRAFTIVELIIVIAVIGVLAAILIPTFSNVIAKANAKSALSDARNSLTSFLAENIDAVGGSLAPHIVIFVEKAKQFYVFGYTTVQTDPNVGVLTQLKGNPYNKDNASQTLADFITSRNMALADYETALANRAPEMTDDEFAASLGGKLFCLTTTAGAGKGSKAPMDDINSKYVNLNDKITDEKGQTVIANTTTVFDGVLAGTIVDASVANPGGSGGTGGDVVTPTPTVPPTTQWTVTYASGEAGANAQGMPAAETVNDGTLYTISQTKPTWTGHNFIAWYNGATEEVGPITVKSNVTLTAHWAEPLPKFTLTFNAGGGTLELGSYTNGTSFDRGTDVSAYIKGATATRSNYTFAGWTDGATTYNAQSASPIPLTKNMTLTAAWSENKYTVSYDLNGGSGNATGGEYIPGATVTLPAAPTKDSNVFNGWKASTDSTTYGAGGSYTMTAANVKFTAQWTAKYKVTYLAHDGSTIAGLTETVNVGSTVTLPAGPARDGFNFTGWNDGTNTRDAGYVQTVNANMTFTAQYTARTYTVTYAANGGTGSMTDGAEYNSGAVVTVKTCTFTAPSGKEFKEWNSKADGTGTAYGATFNITANATLYAIWQNVAQAGTECRFTLNFCKTTAPTTVRDTHVYTRVCSPGTITVTEAEIKAAGAWWRGGVILPGDIFVACDGTAERNPIDTFTWTVVDGTTDYTINIVGIVQAPMAGSIGTTKTKAAPVAMQQPIETQADLVLVGATAADLAKNYILTNNIALTFAVGEKWQPLGWFSTSADVPFTGVFDGYGFSITGLSADWAPDTSTNNTNVGMFANNAGTIKNLKIETTNDGVQGGQCVGIVAGQNSGTITNVHVSGIVAGIYNSSAANDAGGLVGQNLTGGNISCCSANNIRLLGYNAIGGLAGANWGTIERSYATVAGINHDLTDAEVYNLGVILIGGFVGRNNGRIENCYAYATGAGYIKGKQYVGAFIGRTYANSVVVNCFTDAAGYVLGSLNATLNIGTAGGSVTSLYYVASAPAGTGTWTTRADLMSTTFSPVGWDTATVWDFSIANGYPDLRDNRRV